MKLSEIIQNTVIHKAIVSSAEHNDFRLSRLMSLLSASERETTTRDISLELGSIGYIGTIYQERADMGNGGLEEAGSRRVNIEVRHGNPTDTKRLRTRGSGIIKILQTFPDDLR